MEPKLQDPDVQETLEWLEALEAVLDRPAREQRHVHKRRLRMRRLVKQRELFLLFQR